MNKINTREIPEETWKSPKGRFEGAGKQVSIALGRDPKSTDLMKRHPFDVEICRLPAGRTHCPYHSHSAQWEFYHVISGTGAVRHKDGTTPIAEGDAFLFEPGQPHQLINDSDGDLVLYVVADNPIGESCHYPDSGKWMVRSPEGALVRSEPLDYFDGEE
jgi:uncharacterized cupin superfamily protein